VGYLLAACCYFLVFPAWGWRPMFVIGGLPALLAIFVRYRVKESAVWQKTRHESWHGLGRAILSNWRLFLYLNRVDDDDEFCFARHAGYVSDFS
jgi:SHS family lactate transporter-like MFS transporter